MDNSVRYELFIKNMIYSLKKSPASSSTSAILSKNSLTACELMMQAAEEGHLVKRRP